MKTTLLCLAVLLRLASGLRADPTVKEIAGQYLAMFAQTAQARKPVAYPELSGKIEGLFLRYPITHIVINGLSEEGKKTLTDVYIKGEEIYILQADEGWNLVANSSGIYEWEKGETTGIKIKKNNNDLVAYVYYLTDPSWIMASLYSAFLTSPETYTVIPDKARKWTELRRKKDEYGLEAIYVTEKPLWFHGMRFKKGPEARQTNEFTVSAPMEIKHLPADLMRAFHKITFEDSALTLQRHMSFL